MSGLTNVTQANERVQDYRGKIMIGLVIDNEDPMKLQRIRVMVPDIIEGDKEDLPWCIPETLSGGGGPDECVQNIPRVGSHVYIWLQDGDTHFPVYRGQVTNKKTVLGVLAENYPHRVGWQRKGHHQFVDHKTDLYEYHHPKGYVYRVLPDGTLHVKGPESMIFESVGNITMKAPTVFVEGSVEVSDNLSVGAAYTGVFSAGGHTITVKNGIVVNVY